MKSYKKLIVIAIVFLIVGGIVIPELMYAELDSLPGGAQNGIKTLVEHPVEEVLILGYKQIEVEAINAMNATYHVKAYTFFGLTYADIFITVDEENHIGGGAIERKLFFKE